MGGASVSKFFFLQRLQIKKNVLLLLFSWGGVEGPREFLFVQFFFFFFFWGGGGGGGGGGEVIFFFFY